MENKLYNIHVVTKIDKLDIYIHEFKVNKITKQYYFLDMKNFRKRDKKMLINHINKIFKNGRGLCIWCEEKDIEYYKNVLILRLKENLENDKIEYAKIKDMQIEIIDDYLNTDVHDEIKITKM